MFLCHPSIFLYQSNIVCNVKWVTYDYETMRPPNSACPAVAVWFSLTLNEISFVTCRTTSLMNYKHIQSVFTNDLAAYRDLSVFLSLLQTLLFTTALNANWFYGDGCLFYSIVFLLFQVDVVLLRTMKTFYQYSVYFYFYHY